jgi:glycosyltransferase involved in cell wall biosynthesis
MEVADKIIAVSHYTKNMIVNKYGIEPDKIEVIHNAVNRKIQFSRYNIRKPFDEKLVLFLGRITEQKGPKYFLEAAAKVLNKMDNVRFVMSGNGNLFPDIITRVAELEIIDRFHFTGFLKGSDVERIYAMSDIYVMPSVSEPFGIAPFEAILYDIPVIISKQSGASEILKHALKVDFWDFVYLAETIISLLENDELRNNCINQCKDDMKNLTWSGAAEQIIKVYEKVNKKNF